MSNLLKKIILASLFLLCSAAAFAQTITSFNPTTITAGTGSILTIEGTGFGTTQGLAAFRDPDVVSFVYTLTFPIDITSWTDTRITVRVPSEAATGRFVVQLANGTNIFSSTDITVKYSILNVYNPDTSSTQSKMINHNGLGGYTFQFSTDFNSNAAASASFTRALNSWKCASNVNWSIGTPTTINADALDGINIVKYGDPSETGVGVLAYCRTWRTKCATGNWETVELDIVVNNSQPFNYTTGLPSFSQYDFETIAVHELGHGHGLEHVLNPTDFMHPTVALGAVKRTLNPSNLEAAQYVMNYSIASTGSTCYLPMVALPSGSCPTGIAAPTIASFTPTSAKAAATVTITGTNFANVSGVSFGATNASAFTVVSPTSITATVGAGTTGSVTVTTASGSATLAGFTFIPKTSQTITAPGWQARTFGDADFDHNISASSALPVTIVSSNPTVATIVGNKIHILAAGSSTITASQTGNADFDAATTLNLTLTVNKADQTITFPALLTVATNAPDYDPGATASSGLAVTYTTSDPLVANIVGGKIDVVALGTATITASQSGNSNYNAATAVGRLLTVGKQSQTITFNPMPNKVIGDPDFEIGATVSSSLPLSYTSSNPAVAIIVGTKIRVLAAGNTTITVSQVGNTAYDPAPNVSRNLTVNKLQQTITFNAIPNKVIGDPDFEIDASASSDLPLTYGSSNPAVATIIDNKIHILAAGNTTITVFQDGNATYDPAPEVSQNLTVNKQQQSITFNTIPNKVIGDPDFDIGATVSSGLPLSYTSSNPAVALIVGTKIHILAAGSTIITVSQTGNARYASAPDVSQNLTVSKLQQTITFNTFTNKVFGDPDFEIGATASSGLAPAYISSDPSIASIVGTKVHILNAGTVNITALQSGNLTYAIAPNVVRSLTINKAQQTISFSEIGFKNSNDPDFTLSATSSAGLPVSYKSANTNIATVSGNQIHIVSEGRVLITAMQPGSTNYNAAPEVNRELVVGYLLPATNFRLQSTDETCRASNNGTIAITAAQALNYTAVITGNNKTSTQAFSASMQLTGLEAGVYSICITVAGSSTYKQCFDAIIKEPKDLAVFSSINKDGNSVFLKLEGGTSYTIELNGEVITTTQQEISLPLIKGNNVVKISTDKTCQGVIEKAFLTTNSVLIYPNPVKDVLNINMGSTVANNIKVDIQSLDGRLVQTSNQRVEYGRITLNLPQLPRGLYILTLTSKNEKTTHKFIKE